MEGKLFGAAIGGAILGMMLTLMWIAIINGGTLSFANKHFSEQRDAALEYRIQNIERTLNLSAE